MADYQDLAVALPSVAQAINTVGNSLEASKTRKFNAEQAKISRDWQLQMYEKQISDQIKFWNMQNQYSSPANQMALMSEAGINPYVAFDNLYNGSNNSISSGSFPSSVSASSPLSTPFNFDFSGISDQIFKKKQMQLTNESLANQNSLFSLDRMLKNLETIDKQISVTKNETELDILKSTKSAIINNISLQNEHLGSQIHYQNLQNDFFESTKDINKQLLELQSDTYRYDLEYLKPAQLQQVKASISSIYQSIQESFSRIQLNDQTISNLKTDKTIKQSLSFNEKQLLGLSVAEKKLLLGFLEKYGPTSMPTLLGTGLNLYQCDRIVDYLIKELKSLFKL